MERRSVRKAIATARPRGARTLIGRRRLVGMALVGPLASFTASARPAGRVARIGMLGNQNPATAAQSVEAFLLGMRELGWNDGQNLQIVYRWADGNLDRHPALAAELAALPVDVIVTSGPPAARAARQATATIPIVVAIMSDPVALGFAASLARPGGNITGLANLFEELTPKQLQIFKEAMSGARRIALLADPRSVAAVRRATEAAAPPLGLETRVLSAREPAQLDAAFKAAREWRADGVHVLPSPFFGFHRARIAALAVQHRLPSISESREYVQDGGLMSYGPSFAGMWRRSASHVDRILKGARAGDLPIEQPTRFELVINMATARAIGVAVPQSLLLRADELIG